MDESSNLNIWKVGSVIFLVLTLIFAYWTWSSSNDLNELTEKTKLDVQSSFNEGKTAGLNEAYTSDEAIADNVVVPIQELNDLQEQLNKANEAQTTESNSNSYREDNLELGAISFNVDNDDVAKFKDTELSYEGEDYDFEESLGIEAEIGYSGNSLYDEDLADKSAVVCLGEPCIGYTLRISDAFPWDEIDQDNDLDLEFLGRSLKVIGADASADKITIVYGLEQFMNAGDTVVFDGKELTLIQTSDNSVVVGVDGVREVIKVDNDERVNGLDVYVEVTSNDEGIEFDGAKLFISKASDDARDTVNDGDRFIGEDRNDPLWRWVINLDEAGESVIGVVYDRDMQDADDEGTLNVGESLCLPYDYACFTFEQDKGIDLRDYTADFRTEDFGGIATKVVKIDGRFEENNDAVYLNEDICEFFEKEDGDFVSLGDTVTADDTDGIELSCVGGILKIGDYLEFEVDADSKQWISAITTEGVNLNTAEDDVLTADGILVNAPEDIVSDNDEELRFSVPEEQPEFSLVFN